MLSSGEYLEKLIDECGGMGRFQGILTAITLGSKISVTFSMLMMSFAGAVPDWYCVFNSTNATSDGNQTSDRLLKKCHPSDSDRVKSCETIIFGNEMNTVVNEWSLICDDSWIPSTVTTIQMAGLLVSGFIVGQMADYFGRKPVYFLSLFLLTILNIVAGFSTSWKMFAVLRFLLGFGCGCYLIVYYNFISEFIPHNYRPFILAIPSWSTWAALFGLVSMLIHDWRYLHFATAICTAPFLLTWSFVPESFRWLASHRKFDQAEEIINKIASWNRKPVPDLGKLTNVLKEQETSKVFNIKDLFITRALRKTTLILAVGWIACGYVYYAISFGVQSLSGSLYLNMFLLSLVEIPGGFIIYFSATRFGRRPSALCFLLIAGIGGIVVGAVQLTDAPNKSSLINGFALTSKLGVSGGWSAIMVITTESYPTVVRNIGYGFQNAFARCGAMIAPQVVFLNDTVPGLLYFICGASMLITCLCTAFISETKGQAMDDTIVISDKLESRENVTKQKQEISSISYNMEESTNM